jgi:hypothetical protein
MGVIVIDARPVVVFALTGMWIVAAQFQSRVPESDSGGMLILYLPFPDVFNGVLPTLPLKATVPDESSLGVKVMVPIMSPEDSAVNGLVTSHAWP